MRNDESVHSQLNIYKNIKRKNISLICLSFLIKVCNFRKKMPFNPVCLFIIYYVKLLACESLSALCLRGCLLL